LADIVAKVFWASERERLIQSWLPGRNIDSRTNSRRFVCFKIQFYRRISATFATQSAHRVISLRRGDSVAA
jgi:hypothetical protein